MVTDRWDRRSRAGEWEGWSYAGSAYLAFRDARHGGGAGHSCARQAYPVAAIMCGNRVVWLSGDMVQQQVGLSDPDLRPATPPRQQRGNRVQAGAAAPEGQD